MLVGENVPSLNYDIQKHLFVLKSIGLTEIAILFL